MTGAFTWAQLDYSDRRKSDRRSGNDRRSDWRTWLSVVADRAIAAGISEDKFCDGILAVQRVQARKVYRERSPK